MCRRASTAAAPSQEAHLPFSPSDHTQTCVDASACKGKLLRTGAGRVEHLITTHLRAQHNVEKKMRDNNDIKDFNSQEGSMNMQIFAKTLHGNTTATSRRRSA